MPKYDLNTPRTDVRVVLEIVDREALYELAELLGEIAAELYLDGKALTETEAREIVAP